MRTSRVQPTPSSIFRNSRQYLQSNEQFYRALQEGGHQQFSHQQGSQKRKKQKGKNDTVRKVLKTTAKKVLVKGLQFDADSITSMQNTLLKHSVKLNATRNRVSRIRTYRTSI